MTGEAETVMVTTAAKALEPLSYASPVAVLWHTASSSCP